MATSGTTGTTSTTSSSSTTSGTTGTSTATSVATTSSTAMTGSTGGATGTSSTSGIGGNGGSAGVGGRAGTGGSAGTGGRAGTGGALDAGRDSNGAGGSKIDAGRDAAGGSAGSMSADAGGLVDQLLNLTKACANVVSSHDYALDNGQRVNICGMNGAAYWTADMDIDCDGRNVGDGKCPGNDCCYQPDTSFHNNSGQPLAASVTPYVVIPNDFHFTGLDTTNGGNVIAVIYNRQLIFAVFGDTGPTDIIGEASYATAAKLGINPDPGNGGAGSGVTYIAFVGAGTRPSDIENQTETATLGQQLAQKLIQNNP